MTAIVEDLTPVADLEAWRAARNAELLREDARRAEERRQARRVARWEAIAEGRRRLVETDRARLPNVEAFNAVCSWQCCGDGLVLTGDTGRGKSRAMLALARRLILDEGRVVRWVSDDEFGPSAVRAARDGEEIEFVRDYVGADVVMWDDMGKLRITPAVESLAFSVVARCGDAAVPMIISTQFSLDRLAERFREPETGVALARRLAEFCSEVRF
jgi:DNA replication protein DnaC